MAKEELQPALSVIVPVYNAERYIEEAIRSILHQDFEDFELLLVDDCSSDSSADLIRPFLSERVFYLRHTSNSGGPAGPRNTGLRHARGRFVLLFDADDVMLPGKLRLTTRLLTRYPDVGLLCTNFQSIDTEGRIVQSESLAGYRDFRTHLEALEFSHCYRLRAADAYRALLAANFVGTSSVAIPRTVISQVGGFDESLTNGDDYDMWLRITYRYDALFVDRVLHSYRLNPEGVSSRGVRNVTNRIVVLKRQLGKSAHTGCASKLRRKIHSNYRQLADAYRRQGSDARAFQYYRESFRYAYSWTAFMGILLLLLPAQLRRALRSYR